MNDSADMRAVADWLVRAHGASLQFAPFAAAHGVETLADAYQVQAEYMKRVRAARGAGVAGYKIGLTSAAMQKMCGIDSPVAGVMLDDIVHSSGAQLNPANYGHLGIEFEVAVRLGRALDQAGHTYTLEDVQGAVDAVAPAVEVVDDRNCDYKSLDILSLVADNAWNAGVVLGEFRSSWPDLAEVEGRMLVDGHDSGARGVGRDVLGHPFNSVAWLATHLCAQGANLRAGDIVMTGSMITTRFPSAGQDYRFELAGLGSVSVRVSGSQEKPCAADSFSSAP
ncbi:MAG: fumarylacetoacetate hydrolase family protein [Ramlibacter sp.]